jgi:soluble lytic murein transglycosylase-like protein
MRAVSLLGIYLCLASPALADVYLHRDASGVLHFTNAPAEGPVKRVLRERKLPLMRTVPPPSSGYASAAYYYRPITRLSPLLTSVGPTSYDQLIRETAARYDLEYALVKAVIKAESSFNRMAVSPKGALGLMQLMPQTARMHGVRNVFMPHENIEGGCRHLRMLHERYRGNIPLIVAAYNAGEKRVDDARGVPNIPETREYLTRVLRYRLAYLREGAGVLQAAGVQQARSN